MSTLNIDNYENHRPQSFIYQNLEVVQEGSIDRTAAVFVGDSKGMADTKNYPGLIAIRSTKDIINKLWGGQEEDGVDNVLANAAAIGLVAGGGDAFYVIPADSVESVPSVNSILSVLNSESFGYSAISTNTDLSSKLQSELVGQKLISAEQAAFLTEGNLQTLNGGTVPKDANVTAGYVHTILADNPEDLDDETTSWNKAMTILSNSDKTMHLCPLTFDKKLQQIAQTTALDLSQPDVQKWKRVYCPVPPSGNSSDPDIDNSDTASTIITAVNTFTAPTLGEYAAQRTVYIWSAGANTISSDEDGNTTISPLSNIYVAAGITALRASILPQQGLSRRVVSWIYSIPNAYIMFDRNQLNQIAVGGSGNGGCFIITQDDEDSDVYVRHQLTNDLTRGIMYYEDSAGVNVDTLCYGLKDIAMQYIGQYNNIDLTLLEIKNKVTDYLLSLTNTGVSLEARKLGPQISSVDLESVKVYIDPTYRDRVIISADIVVPLPINQIHVHLNAFASLQNSSTTV